MNGLSSTVASCIPWRVRHRFRTAHRRLVFGRAMGRFMAAPERALDRGNTVLDDLVYGWGNESWSAMQEYLQVCIRQALESKGPFLECGSGLSTVLIGAIAKRRGIHHWALEHTPAWAERVGTTLRRYGIDSVKLCVQPLREYGDFTWYDPPLASMPDDFSLVICDGPPASTPGGRFGLVPVMRDKLAPRCVILLDDAGREQERLIAERWAADLGATSDRLGSAKPYITLTLGDAPTT